MTLSCHTRQEDDTASSATEDAQGDEYILIVDDDPGISDIVAMVLRDEEGYAVRLATTLRQVLSRPPDCAPQMVLLDATLPGENVLLTGAELRQLPGWRDTPIVLCSARDDIARLARELGAAAYLKKPFDIDELIAVAGAFAR